MSAVARTTSSRAASTAPRARLIARSTRCVAARAATELCHVDARVIVFSCHSYEKTTLEAALPDSTFVSARLQLDTVPLARDHDAVCVFVDDDVGTDVDRANARGVTVCRVPAYDPLSIAEHAVGMMLSLNRRLGPSRDRLRVGNYTLDGLVGQSLKGKTIGIVGTGKIGRAVAKICKHGFQMEVLGYDLFDKEAFCGEFCSSIEDVLARSDFVSVHVPLTDGTRGMFNAESLAKMKIGAMLINTSRGALVDARACIDALYSGQLGALAMEVYEKEQELFFRDFSTLDIRSRMLVWDENMAILSSLPQVLITPHSAFLTHEALAEIASTTAENLRAYCAAEPLANRVSSTPQRR
jgi:D-lactate dehydrogenase